MGIFWQKIPRGQSDIRLEAVPPVPRLDLALESHRDRAPPCLMK